MPSWIGRRIPRRWRLYLRADVMRRDGPHAARAGARRLDVLSPDLLRLFVCTDPVASSSRGYISRGVERGLAQHTAQSIATLTGHRPPLPLQLELLRNPLPAHYRATMDAFFTIAAPVAVEQPQIPQDEERSNNSYVTSSCVIA